MLKKVALVLGIVVAALLVVIATRPEEFKVARSATVAAPAIVAFSQVNDFRAWAAWSPWEKLDPGMKKVYEGSPSGTGAIYSWSGNDDVGVGRMTILDSKPGERVVIKLEFIKPFEQTNVTTFTFTPQGDKGDSTKVDWLMEGKNNFMSKAFGLFVNVDKMVGNDFEKGLAQMKVAAEGEAQKLAAAAAAAKAADEVAAAAKAAEAAAAPPAEAPAAGVSH
jgi:hypothetical protein